MTRCKLMHGLPEVCKGCLLIPLSGEEENIDPYEKC